MKITETKLKNCLIIEPEVFQDSRGWFFESYSKKKLPVIKEDFVQDNHSYSGKKGTIRGIHLQNPPFAQGKLVRCIRGVISDVAVDLRKGSGTYKQWVMIKLSEDNRRMLYIPRGFGHGFVSLTDNVELLYKADAYYNPEAERTVRWDDPEIGIPWNVENPVVSEKDRNAPFLKDCDIISL